MKRKLLLIAGAILLAIFIIKNIKLESVDTHSKLDETDSTQFAYVTIDCSVINEHIDELDPAAAAYAPSDGVILKKTKIGIDKGDTAFDLLCKATKQRDIQMEYQGGLKSGGSGAYIQGINYIYEFSCGPLSGWMYKVNGKFPDRSCSKHTIKNGDSLEYLYTCDLGRDIGCEFDESQSQR